MRRYKITFSATDFYPVEKLEDEIQIIKTIIISEMGARNFKNFGSFTIEEIPIQQPSLFKQKPKS